VNKAPVKVAIAVAQAVSVNAGVQHLQALLLHQILLAPCLPKVQAAPQVNQAYQVPHHPFLHFQVHSQVSTAAAPHHVPLNPQFLLAAALLKYLKSPFHQAPVPMIRRVHIAHQVAVHLSLVFLQVVRVAVCHSHQHHPLQVVYHQAKLAAVLPVQAVHQQVTKSLHLVVHFLHLLLVGAHHQVDYVLVKAAIAAVQAVLAFAGVLNLQALHHHHYQKVLCHPKVPAALQVNQAFQVHIHHTYRFHVHSQVPTAAAHHHVHQSPRFPLAVAHQMYLISPVHQAPVPMNP
jgi:hypothetical protein